MLKRTLAGIIRSHEQSSERTQDETLRTRYYKLNKDKAWDELVQVVNILPGYRKIHEAKNVGEIILQKRTITGRIQDITVTLYGVNPLKTAVDIYSASRGSFGDLGSNYRNIAQLYERMDKQLNQYKL